jgi:phage tail-like protein
MAVNQARGDRGTGAQPGVAVDPFRAYNFKLIIQGITEAQFTACSGVGAKVPVLRYRTGGEHQVVHVLPGPVEYADVTLSYGMTRSRALFDWMLSVVKGDVQRKNVSILLLDSTGTNTVIRWNLIRAWPSEWLAAPLDALQPEIAIARLTLVYESLEQA